MLALFARMAIALLLPIPALASFRVSCEPFDAWMDPIVTPGAKSGHLHSIGGTLGFSDQILPRSMAASSTTCSMTEDHSNYWTPALYRTYPRQPPKLLRPVFQPYYIFAATDVSHMSAATLAQPLAMLLGRSSGGTAEVEGLHIEFQARVGPREASLGSHRFGWHDAASDVREVLIDYYFPSCWNGGRYFADQRHVAYPDAATNACPRTHRFQFPAVRLEQRYILDPPYPSWSNGNAPFFFSSGGETTAHADVVLLWNATVLRYLFTRCASDDASGCDQIGPRQDTGDRVHAASSYIVPPRYAYDPSDPVTVPSR